MNGAALVNAVNLVEKVSSQEQGSAVSKELAKKICLRQYSAQTGKIVQVIKLMRLGLQIKSLLT